MSPSLTYQFKQESNHELLTRLEYTLRFASPSDLPAIKSIKLDVFAELAPTLLPWYARHPEAFAEEFYGHADQDPNKRCMLLVIDTQGQVLGCGGIMQWDPTKEPTVGELADIYLVPLLRGKGIGRALVTELISHETPFGFDSIKLTTRVEFVAAVKLYQRLGFLPIENTKYTGSANSIAFQKLFPRRCDFRMFVSQI